MLEERQAAVEAILEAGHIPAGMELFSAGNSSQIETIKRWIESSDVYLLILGGRYGAIESNTQKSYTQLEYEYAIEKGIPVFAVVIKDGALEAKVKRDGPSVIEMNNQTKYKEFKELVLSKICEFFDDTKDIKLAIHKTLVEFQRQYKFAGWVSGREVENYDNLEKENRELLKENKALQTQLKKHMNNTNKKQDEEQFSKIKEALGKILVQLPEELSEKKEKVSVEHIFAVFHDQFAIGVDNQSGTSKISFFLFSQVAPHLMKFGLVEKAKVPQRVFWEKIHTSKLGYEFLQYCALNPESEGTKKVVKKKAN